MTIPTDWTTGEYIAEYVITSAGSTQNQARYSPFVVRSTAPQAQASKILVVVPHNTYLAYNKFGGTSAYVNETNGHVYSGEHATKVSLNRPYHTREWSDWDYPMLRFLEREGYDVSYVADADVDANPNILQQHQMVIVSGHSEYWTKNMRDGFQNARDNGVSLFFAGGNDAFWQVRYEDSSCADDDTVCNNPGDRRTMVIYKMREGDPVDPITDPTLKTIRFRELNRSECELQGGVQWEDPGYFPDDGYANTTVTAAGAADRWMQGTGLTTGSTIVGMAGTEFDSFWPDCQTPAAPTILFQYKGDQPVPNTDATSVKYQTPGSGARVFSSGNLHFSFTLDSWRWNPALFTGIPPQDTRMQQFTRNVLGDMQRPAPPTAINVSQAGSSVQTTVTPKTDSRITSYKIYRHAGTGSFLPSDSGVTLVCQNATGSCTDNPAAGTYRYAAVAVDQWNDSEAALSSAFTSGQPTAVNDTATLDEDPGATALDVLANDQDPSNVGKTITSRTQPANGNVVITGGGTGLTYQPNANYCNTPPGTTLDTFTYTLNGGSSATVTVTVNCVDDGPTAVADSISLSEDSGSNTRTLTTNDTDIDGGPRTITAVTQPAHGSVSIGANTSQAVYTPDANYCNTPPGTALDTFTYTVNGGSSATVSVTVNCDDDPPLAVADAASVAEDAAAELDRRAHERHRHGWRPEDRCVRHPACQRQRGCDRRRHRTHLPARRQLLQQPAGHVDRQLQLCPQRGLHGHGLRNSQLRRRPAERNRRLDHGRRGLRGEHQDGHLERHGHRRWPEVDRLRYPAGTRHGQHRGEQPPDRLHASRELLQQSVGGHAGHLHLHAQRRRQRDGLGNRDLRRRPAGCS